MNVSPPPPAYTFVESHVEPTLVWRQWMLTELCQIGAAANDPATKSVFAKVVSETATLCDAEWQNAICVFKANRINFLIGNIVDGTVPLIGVHLIRFSQLDALKQIRDWIGRRQLLALQEDLLSAEADERHLQKHIDQCKAANSAFQEPKDAPITIVTDNVADLSRFVTIDGNHRVRKTIRKAQANGDSIELFAYLLVVGEKQLFVACKQLRVANF